MGRDPFTVRNVNRRMHLVFGLGLLEIVLHAFKAKDPHGQSCLISSTVCTPHALVLLTLGSSLSLLSLS